MIVLLVLLALIAGVVFWAVSVYNRLIRMQNLKNEAWSGIDVQLKRRFDLVPNLVETVKGYASHERKSSKRSPRPGRPSATPSPWASGSSRKTCSPAP